MTCPPAANSYKTSPRHQKPGAYKGRPYKENRCETGLKVLDPVPQTVAKEDVPRIRPADAGYFQIPESLAEFRNLRLIRQRARFVSGSGLFGFHWFSRSGTGRSVYAKAVSPEPGARYYRLFTTQISQFDTYDRL